MSVTGGTFNRVVPNSQDPNISSVQSQIVPINALVGKQGVQTYAQSGDLGVYRLNMRPQTPASVNQSRINGQVNEVSYKVEQISTPLYMFKLRAINNYFESLAMERLSIPHQQVLESLLQQGLAQSQISAFFFGALGSNGEGFLNDVPVTVAPSYTPTGGTLTNKWSLIDPLQLCTTILLQFRNIGINTLNRGITESVAVSNRLYQLLTKTYPLTSQFAGLFGQTMSVWTAITFSLTMSNIPVPMLVATDLLKGDATNPDYMCFITPDQTLDSSPFDNQNAFGNVRNDNRLVTMVQAGGVKMLNAPLSAENIELVAVLESSSGWVLSPNANVVLTALYQ